MSFVYSRNACHPHQDVPVPAALFDTLAGTVFEVSGKRPELKLRSALSTLVRLSLLNGSLAGGLFQVCVLSTMDCIVPSDL